MKKWCITLGVLVALLLAAVLPVSAAGYGPVVAESEIFNVTISGQQNYDEISQELVLLNQERAKAGLHPLKLDPTLTAYAMQRAAEISVFYGEDHSRPDTSGCFSIFQGVYANTSGYGENIARGYANAASVMNGWMNSEGHRNNILTARYNSVGLGCFHQPDGTKAWVQMFHSYNYTGYYAPSGVVQQGAVPIRIYREYLGLSTNLGSSAQLFPGEVTYLQLYLFDKAGRSGGTPCPVTSTYSVSQSLPSACILQGNKFTAKSTPGSVSYRASLKNDYYTYWVDGTFQVVNKPTLQAEFDGFNTIVLTWGASCPRGIIYYTDHNKGGGLIKLASTSGTVRRMTNVEYDNRYTFSIYDENMNLISNSVTVSTALPKPKAPTAKITGLIYRQYASLSWDYQDDVSRYEVYRATSKSGKYTKIGEARNTAYTDYEQLNGSTYFYKVRGVNQAGNAGAFSSPVLLKRKLVTPKPKATALTNGNIRLTWAKVTGADTYTVYRRAGKTGTYQLLTTVKGTAYTNSSGKAGVRYYYKVVASNSVTRIQSQFSAATAATKRLAKPTLKVTLSSKKPYLKWNKVSGATKYVIYRATSKNGKYTKLKTVTGTAYRNTTAKKGKTYYYKVYAVCSRSAGKSAASTVKSIKSK